MIVEKRTVGIFPYIRALLLISRPYAKPHTKAIRYSEKVVMDRPPTFFVLNKV